MKIYYFKIQSRTLKSKVRLNYSREMTSEFCERALKKFLKFLYETVNKIE